MLALNSFGTVSHRVWSALRIYGAWVCCVAICLATAWVWRSTLLIGYLTLGFSPEGFPLFNVAITVGLALLFLILVVVFEGLCRTWAEKGLLGPRFARVIGLGSLAIGAGLSLLSL